MSHPGGKARRAKPFEVSSRQVGRRGRGRPSGTDYFTRYPDAADAVEAILARQQIAAPRVMELLGAGGIDPLPGIATLRRFMARLESERPALLASMRDPDLYKSRYRLALGRADGAAVRPHQVWEIDTTKADVLTKGGRVMILGLIDQYTRRARFMVAPSESGQSVRRLLIDAIEAWGVVPEAVSTDNGSGYVNGSVASALELLGIEHYRCAPGSPEKKPFVERLFGTFTRERAELLAGYAGHNVADAQRLRARAKKETGRAVVVPELEPEQLQVYLDAWVDGVYHARRHSSLGCSPMQAAAAYRGPLRAAPPADALRMALSALVGTRRVGKRGINWKNGRYWADGLAAWVGREVMVRRDEDDLGALLVFDLSGRFIDTAVDHGRAGISEAEFAEAARRRQAAHMAEARAEVRSKMRRFDVDAAIAERLRRDAEAAGKLTALPPRTAPHTTPTLDSLVEAPAPSMPSRAEIEATLARRPKMPEAPTRSVQEKIETADRILAAAARGEAIDQADLRRARNYAASSEYRAEKLISAHFAESPTRSRIAPADLKTTVKGSN